MQQVSILETKNNLSALVRNLEEGLIDEYVIARHKKPVAKLTFYEPKIKNKRIGVAKTEVLCADGWDDDLINDEVASIFGVDE